MTRTDPKLRGERQLVIEIVRVAAAEADRIRPDRPAAVLRHHPHHRARVDAAREECTHGHISDHLIRNGSAQAFLDFVLSPEGAATLREHGLTPPIKP